MAAASLGALGLSTGCSKQTGLGSSSGTEDSGVTEGANIVSNNDGKVGDRDIVAEIIVEAPESTDFVLSATIPVPKGTLTENSMSVPLSIRAGKDRAAPTQVEVVSWYPNLADGADVVQVLAHVRRPYGVEPGEKIRYEVGLNPHRRHPLSLPAHVGDFIDAPGALKLIAKDAFGNPYEADLLADVREQHQDGKVLADGHVMRKVSTHEVLLPSSPTSGSTGTLPHFMGVHSYVTAYRGQSLLSVDLHVHNGMDGLDVTTSEDDALAELYFQGLDLRIPQGWRVMSAFKSPSEGTNITSGSTTRFQIIKPRPDGKMHVMPSMSRFIRRLVVYRPEFEDRARELVQSRWQGFCAAGSSPTQGEFWSWWNPDTARYLVQNHVLPELDYADLESIEQGFQTECSQRIDQVRTGTSPGYPIFSPGLGWAHPWGPAYGGMTGGDEIELYSGHRVAATASNDGLRLIQLRNRCYVDRQPQALYDVQGRPTAVEDLLMVSLTGVNYVPLLFHNTPVGGSDPFGFAQAPQFQIEAVRNAGLAAPYEQELSDFMPVDYQHYIRYTKDLKSLVWLSNDAIAKDLSRSASETFRLSFHQYPNNSGGGAQVTGLKALRDFVNEFPGQGLTFGRGESWGTDISLVAYATSDQPYRESMRPWIDTIVDTVTMGQSTCNGNIMSAATDQLWSGAYRIRLVNEASFTDNLLLGLSRTVYDGVDSLRKERLEEMLVASVRSSIGGSFWSQEFGAPWYITATAPNDPNLQEFCGSLPAGLHSQYANTTELYSSLAYAYELTGDQEFLYRAAEMLGGGDLWNLLQNQGDFNLHNTAALVALCQDLNSNL